MTSTVSSRLGQGNEVERWDAFIRFARQFYEARNYDSQERDYKLLIGERLVDTQNTFRSGSEDWINQLKRAVGKPNNLTRWQDHDPVIKWCREYPAGAAAAFQMLWDPGRSVPDRLDDFIEEAASAWKIRILINVASFLHMAMDPISYPIFRARPVADAMKLTGYPSRQTSVGARYEHYLGFLDRILAEGSQRGLEFRDRLDAQSVAWMITSYPPASNLLQDRDWSPEERQAFAAYRGVRLPSEKNDQSPPSDQSSPERPVG